MNFSEALARLLKGQRMTRAIAGGGQYIGFMMETASSGGYLYTGVSGSGRTTPYTPSQEDLLAEDWQVAIE